MPTYTTFYSLAKPLVNSPVDEDLWGSELNDNMDIIDTTMHDLSVGTGGAYVPSGMIADFAGTAAPTGWLLCYGQAVSRATYSDLFTAIGTTWGAGDGSTTFNLPDFRGRVGAGKDDMGGSAAGRLTTAASGVDGLTVGAAGGAQTHTLVTAEIPSHSHTFTGTPLGTHSHTGNIPFRQTAGASLTELAAGNVGGANTLNNATSSVSAGTPAGTNANTGGDGAHNNTQPTAVVLKIIKT